MRSRLSFCLQTATETRLAARGGVTILADGLRDHRQQDNGTKAEGRSQKPEDGELKAEIEQGKRKTDTKQRTEDLREKLKLKRGN
jgi:hypothetical protein